MTISLESSARVMSHPHVDTDVIVRLLTGDDTVKQAAAASLFEQVASGNLTIAASDTVIADAVYVLSSSKLYRLARQHIASMLRPLVALPGFHVQHRSIVLRALDLYETTNLDWGDVMIAASMERTGSTVLYSYDRDFDRLKGLTRLEPSPA